MVIAVKEITNFKKKNTIESYVKYNWFHKEQTKKFKQDISKVNNLYYNEKDDYFVCSMGQKMYLKRQYERITERGYKQQISVYETQNCKGCPIRGMCHKSNGNRNRHINHKLLAYRKKARENLLSEQGIKYRKKRAVEPESVFGQIKQNKGFRRFALRGLEMVEIEFGLIAIAHNLQKLWKWLLNNRPSNKEMSFLSFYFVLKKQIFALKTLINQKITSQNTKPIILTEFYKIKEAVF